MRFLFLQKSHVKGYTRSDGVYVKDYDTKVVGKPANASAGKPAPKPKPEGYHPKPGEKGERIAIRRLSKASGKETWGDKHAVATFLPGGEVPEQLGGVKFAPWDDAPTDAEGWNSLAPDNLDEPPFECPENKIPASGVIIQERDGRFWLVAPTNAFGGYKATFPKGGQEDGLSLSANAMKECYEEAGLKVEILGHLMDVDRSTSKARYYLARRVGGTPADMGWESQAVHLAPASELYKLLNNPNDHAAAEELGAGPKPKQPKPAYSGEQKGLF